MCIDQAPATRSVALNPSIRKSVVLPSEAPEKQKSDMALSIRAAGVHDAARIWRLVSEIDTLDTIVMPDVPELIAPIVYAVPVQMLAYHTAMIMGTDVDQPRNLAKSVTVE